MMLLQLSYNIFLQRLIIFYTSKIEMYQIDMAMYEQMGFTKEQVKKAYEYSQKNKIDIFDALQYLQKGENRNQKQSPQPKSKPSDKMNESSLLYPFKNINLSNYQIIFSTKGSRMNLPGKKVDLRDEFSPVGLLNVYNCCYLNSLLQCYFLSSELMKYIFEAEPLSSMESLESKISKVKLKRIQNQYNLLHTLKQIFSKMCLTSKKYIDPTQVLRNLVDSVGQKVEYGDEKDLFETNISIIERLNECLLYTKKYFKAESKQKDDNNKEDDFSSVNSNGKTVINNSRIKQRDSIKHLFYGQKVEYTDPVNQKEPVSEVLSDFLGIIINPAHENLYRALHQEFHYEVEIEIPDQKRKVKTKKHTYIREVPEYLYFYINRTGYNAREKQPLKNSEKLSFDFVIYLDRFLQKYKQQSSANTPLIIELWKKKNQLQKRINAFDIFSKKLQECRQLASNIDGWKEKLPDQSEIDSQKQTIEKQLKDIEKQLQMIESRKEKYCLMYIFVHRGDAVSGHYWGYGRNSESWYKFDINTKQMKEDEILLDLYKSGGTPYSLVYVKQNRLPKITYKYHKDFSILNEVSLMDITENNQHKNESSYIRFIPEGLKKVVIAENIQLHQEFEKRRNVEITNKVVTEYLTRLNWIQNEALQKQKNQLKSAFRVLPSYDNLALYLWMKNQVDLSKYNIFSVSVKAAANVIFAQTQIQPIQLIQDEVLLTSIQKEFRKKVKKNKILKHFCIEVQPKEGEKYLQQKSNYLLEKQFFIIILGMVNAVIELQKSRNESKLFSSQKQGKVNKILKRSALLTKNGTKNQSYIKHIFKEFVGLFILKCLRQKCILKINDEQLETLASQNLIKQLQVNGFKQNLLIEKGQINDKEYLQSCKKHAKAEEFWASEEIGKGPNRQLLQKKFSLVMPLLKTEVMISKRLQKEGKLSNVNGEIQDLKVQIPQKEQQQSLI